MAIAAIGLRIVFGVPDKVKPVQSEIPGRMRLRFRNTAPAKAYFKTPDGIRCFILEDCGDHWRINPKLE